MFHIGAHDERSIAAPFVFIHWNCYLRQRKNQVVLISSQLPTCQPIRDFNELNYTLNHLAAAHFYLLKQVACFQVFFLFTAPSRKRIQTMQNEGEAVPGKSFGSVEALKFACVNLSELPRVDSISGHLSFQSQPFGLISSWALGIHRKCADDLSGGSEQPISYWWRGATIQWHGGWDEFLSRSKHLGSLR